MSTAAQEKPKAAVIVPAFGIEVDHPQNCDILLQSIPGCRLRSKIKPTSMTIQGHVRTPTANGQSPPEVPGMQLHVNPAELSYVIFDPLNDDEEAKQRIKRFLNMTTGVRSDTMLKGVDTKKGTLDIHRMKTLCREICWLLDAKEVRVVKGAAPLMDDVEELPGKFLLNPGLRTQSTQPTYEEDLPEWINQLTRSGG